MRRVFLIFLFVILPVAGLFSNNTADKWMVYGKKMYATRHYQDAITSFQNILKGNPENSLALTYVGYCYAQMHDYDEAIEYLEHAYSINKNQRLWYYIQKLKAEGGGEASEPYSYSLSGGAARISSMGGMTIAVPDNTSVIDLYDAGFTSAYFSRPKKSLVMLQPSFDITNNNQVSNDSNKITEQGSAFTPLINLNNNRNIGTVLWLSPLNVIIVKPYYLYEDGETKATYPGSLGMMPDQVSISNYFYALQAEYAQKITPQISLGGLWGYSTVNYGDATFEYALSSTFDLQTENGVTSFSLGLDSKGNINPYDTMAINGLNDFQYEFSNLQNPYNANSMTYSEGNLYYIKNTQKINMKGFEINAGGSYNEPGKIEITGRIAVITSIFGNGNGGQQVIDPDTGNIVSAGDVGDFNLSSNGLGIDSELKARYYFEPLILGAEIKFINVGFQERYSTDTNTFYCTTSGLEAAGGMTLRMIQGILLPIEFFYQSAGLQEKNSDYEYYNNAACMGIRAGIEASLNKEMTIRGGLNYSTGGQTYKETDNTANFIYDNSPYGNNNNPGLNQIGINLGCGFKFNPNTELNAALCYSIILPNPAPNYLSQYSNNNILLLVDFRRFL